MKAQLKFYNISYIDNVQRDAFLSARKGVNGISKLLLMFVEMHASGTPITFSNNHMVNTTNLTEREIQYLLNQMSELNLIKVHYTDASKRFRTSIELIEDEAVKYMNYSRYDDQYVNAPKWGVFRRIVNQIPIYIKNLFNNLVTTAKRVRRDQLLNDALRRRENYNRHIKRYQKRIANYVEDDFVLDKASREAIIEKLKQLGTSVLKLQVMPRAISPVEPPGNKES